MFRTFGAIPASNRVVVLVLLGIPLSSEALLASSKPEAPEEQNLSKQINLTYAAHNAKLNLEAYITDKAIGGQLDASAYGLEYARRAKAEADRANLRLRLADYERFESRVFEATSSEWLDANLRGKTWYLEYEAREKFSIRDTETQANILSLSARFSLRLDRDRFVLDYFGTLSVGELNFNYGEAALLDYSKDELELALKSEFGIKSGQVAILKASANGRARLGFNIRASEPATPTYNRWRFGPIIARATGETHVAVIGCGSRGAWLEVAYLQDNRLHYGFVANKDVLDFAECTKRTFERIRWWS